jgi:hypothetical protein
LRAKLESLKQELKQATIEILEDSAALKLSGDRMVLANFAESFDQALVSSVRSMLMYLRAELAGLSGEFKPDPWKTRNGRGAGLEIGFHFDGKTLCSS